MTITNFTDATLKGSVTGPTFTGNVDGAKFTGSVSTTDTTTPPVEPQPVVVTRNIFQQPFGVNSVWNTALGLGGGGLVAKGTGPHGGKLMKYADNTGPVYESVDITPATYIENDEALLLFGPSSPQQPVNTNPVAWSGGQSARCGATQKPAGFNWPIPANADFLDAIGTTPNASSAVLLADRHTIDSWQPTVICGAGGKVTTETNWNKQDIFADDVTSAYGSHGGSGMSAIGGVIRYMEVTPGNCPYVNGVADVFRHALGVGFNSHMFNRFGSRFWPARNNDTGNEGLLLALLPSFNYTSLTTAPGRALAWACINYGWYLVDCTGWDAMNLPGEYSYGDNSVNCPPGRTQKQWETDWGFGLDNNTPSAAFRNDIKTICKNLYAITNNGASSIGGGAGSKGRLQADAAKGIDPGVITAAPAVTNANLAVSRSGITAGKFIDQIHASHSPFSWQLSGTGATNFWIQPTTGLLYVAAADVAAGTYTLTAKAQNIIGSGSGQVVIVVSA